MHFLVQIYSACVSLLVNIMCISCICLLRGLYLLCVAESFSEEHIHVLHQPRSSTLFYPWFHIVFLLFMTELCLKFYVGMLCSLNLFKSIRLYLGNYFFGNFLVCTSHFVVMFTAADGSGRSTSYHAYISQSTRGLRSSLKEQVRCHS